MDCIVYIDLFFLLNFWMNLLVIFLVRKITKTYRTFWCILAGVLGALFSTGGLLLFLQSKPVTAVLLHSLSVIVINVVAFGKRNILWHLGLFLLTGIAVAGLETATVSIFASKPDVLMVLVVSGACALACTALEKHCRIRWKEEHMKAKTVLEYEDKKMFATALMDTGNKLYDPFYHKPVILVDERMMKEILADCRKHHPEKLQFIPYHSVGRTNGMLEGVMFDCVSIRWQEKCHTFEKVIAAATKESLYKGKEYQVIFHCGLLEER